MKKKLFILGLIITLVVLPILACAQEAPAPAPAPAPTPKQPAPAPAPTPAPSPEKPEIINLSLGATSTTSGSYVPIVIIARIFNEYIPGVRITVVETGAAVDNWVRMKRGDIDFIGVTSSPAAVNAYHGLGAFDGDPTPEGRWLVNWTVGEQRIVVRAESDVYSPKDLDGKKFYYGIPGSGTEEAALKMFDTIGIQPERALGSLGDAQNLMKDNKIVGLMKFSPPRVLDSAIASIKVSTPIRIMSFSEEDTAAILKVFPGTIRIDLPAGSIIGAEEQDRVLTPLGTLSAFIAPAESMNPAFTQDLVYQMAKALDEHWDMVVAGYPGATEADKFVDFINYTADMEELSGLKPIPIHAGIVQYLIEKGFDVPAPLVPPEYKG